MAPYSYEGVEPAPSPAFSSSISLDTPAHFFRGSKGSLPQYPWLSDKIERPDRVATLVSGLTTGPLAEDLRWLKHILS